MTQDSNGPDDARHGDRGRLIWVELVKACAIIWIFLNHVSERLFSFPYIANPYADWPPFQERIAQLQPFGGHGAWNIPLNVLRYVGWFGDQGVQLFLIISGFGLTWGLLKRFGDAPLPLVSFYRRRAARIYPTWWGAHVLFLATGLVGWGMSITNPASYVSMLGFRGTASLLYYFAPAWWYIGLLLQLYLIYPVLWDVLRKRGPMWLLAASCLVGFGARAAGLAIFTDYLDAWSRGAIFITRLPEFAFGVCLAAWLHRAPDLTHHLLRSGKSVAAAAGVYVAATALSLTLFGMAAAPFLLGLAVFVLLYRAFSSIQVAEASVLRIVVWIGVHSYSLYLVHNPVVRLALPMGVEPGEEWRALGGIAGAVVLTPVVAIALEQGVELASRVVQRAWQRFGTAGLLGVGAVLGAAAIVLPIGAELAVRRYAPQEVLGWGERPSLEPHETFGWRLIPSSATRLRWESYDYPVLANSLGFPDPEYPPEKEEGLLRIMTLGDAFTSAEGVQPHEAWPCLLETLLKERFPGRTIQVVNFAITGYGPNQYAAVAREFVPFYRPDLIIVGFFINEYTDVLVTDDEFRDSIGFGRPDPDNWRQMVRLHHLKRFTELHIREPMKELIRGVPADHRYFLGHFAELETERPDITEKGRTLVAERLAEIKSLADSVGARVVIAMIPASVQVCGPSELEYYPRHVNLEDERRFDVDQPQRMTREIADALGCHCYDLREVLRDARDAGPYQPRNMHWTPAGHQVVAAFLVEKLTEDGLVTE